MIIQVDADGRKAISQLCDIALKVGGLNNLQGVSDILGALTPVEPTPKSKLPKEK